MITEQCTNKLRTSFFTILFLLLVSTSGNPASAAGPDKLFDEANKLYREQKYSGARQKYEQLLTEHGLTHPAIFFNLANACYKEGALGKARGYYEKAHILAPRDKDIEYNLSIIRNQLVDKVDVNGSFLSALFSYFMGLVSVREAAWAFWSLSIFCIMGFLLVLNTRNRGLPARLILYGLLPLWSIAAIVFSVQYLVYEYHVQAVAVEEKVDVRSGPGEAFQTLFSVHEGIRLRIVRKSGTEWIMVLLPNGLSGWVPADSFMYINPL